MSASHTGLTAGWLPQAFSPAAALGRAAPLMGRGLLGAGAAVGAVAAGAVLLEAALIPGLAIGAAAVLAPRLLPRLARRPAVVPRPALLPTPAAAALPRIAITRSVVKTVTFRVIVTTLDFTTNYVVLGELGTAAGLSAFSLAVAPVFYLLHETGWNYFGGTVERGGGMWGPKVDLGTVLPGRAGRPLVISRALAKTVTFRTVATVMDFTTNFAVTRDLGTALLLTSTGFVLGPFVYLGHEMAWDQFGGPAAAPGQNSSSVSRRVALV